MNANAVMPDIYPEALKPLGINIATADEVAVEFARRQDFSAKEHDVRDLLKTMGGKIQYVPFFHGRHENELEMRGAHNFTVYLNLGGGASECRTDAAHCLGHILLHYLLRGPDAKVSHPRRVFNTSLECEAWWFAGELLMPKAIIADMLKNGATTLDFVEQFDLSPKVVKARLNRVQKALGS